MRIESEFKLGFRDVLIKPKRSTIKTRAEVQVQRQYTFKHSQFSWSGVPIMAANMDTIGTLTMATALARHQVMTAVHKHYEVSEWSDFTRYLLRHNRLHDGQHGDFQPGLYKTAGNSQIKSDAQYHLY